MKDQIKKTGADIKEKIKFMDKKNKMYIIVMGVVVIIILLLLILSCSMKDKMITYNEVEDKMVLATKKYYNEEEHLSLLPADGTETIIQMQTLVEGKYIKPFNKMLANGDICTGEIKLKNNGGTYLYIPYLSCGTEYFSLELYKKVINNTVSTGDGVYINNEEFVYRGQNVNNFVEFDGKLWRIYKINVNKEAVLIEDEPNKKNYYVFDDRYNAEKKNNSGINNYTLSRLKDSVNSYYMTDLENTEVKKSDGGRYLSDEAKAILVPSNYCVGNRGEKQNKYETAECNVVLDNQYIGLLTVQEYMYVSLDPACVTPQDMQCQNYNYLGGTKQNWWTSTGNSDNTYEAYRVQAKGNILSLNANTKSLARFVITLGTDTFIRGGEGTETKPYIVK